MLQKLFQRRVPHYLIGYLGGFWLLTELLNHATQRYGINQVWADSSFILMLALLPSIALFAWNHGEPGDDRWRRSELVFFAFNISLAVILLVAQPSQHQNAGAGGIKKEMVEKSADKPGRAAYQMVFLAPLTMDDPQDWRTHGVPLLVAYDLSQVGNLYGNTIAGSPNYLAYIDQGYPNAVGVPESALLGYARDQVNSDFLLTGSLETSKDGKGLSAKLNLTDVKKGSALGQFTVEAETSDLLADKITQRLMLEIGFKTRSQDVDLPISSILSRSEPAIEAMIEALMSSARRESSERIIASYDKALKIDPTFAVAWYQKGAILYRSRRSNEARQALLQARKLSDRMPMNMRVQIDIYLAYLDYDYDKAVALLQNWVKMSPGDASPLFMLAGLYSSLNRSEDADKAYRELLEYNPNDPYALSALAESAAGAADYKQALQISERLLANNPKDASFVKRVMENQWNAGNPAKAQAMLPQLEFLDPQAAADFKLNLDIASGNFDEAEKQLRTLIEQTTEKNERNNYLVTLAVFLEKQGRISEANAVIAPVLAENSRKSSNEQLGALNSLLSIIVQSKGEQFTFDLIRKVDSADPVNAKGIEATLLLTTYLALADGEKLPPLIKQLEAFYAGDIGKSGAYKPQMLRWKMAVHMVRDEVAEAEQEYQQLMKLLKSTKSFGSPSERARQLALHATMLVYLGKVESAKAELKLAEQLTPSGPDVVAARYLVAMRTGDLGLRQQAKAWLDNFYKKAEPSSAQYKKLQKLYATDFATTDKTAR